MSGRGWITSRELGRTDGSREGGESARDTKTNGERDGRKSERRREERKAARLGIRVRRWKSSEYGVTAELNEQTRPQRLALIASSTTRPPQFTGTNGRFPCLAACACISVETRALSWRAEELLMLRASLAPGGMRPQKVVGSPGGAAERRLDLPFARLARGVPKASLNIFMIECADPSMAAYLGLSGQRRFRFRFQRADRSTS